MSPFFKGGFKRNILFKDKLLRCVSAALNPLKSEIFPCGRPPQGLRIRPLEKNPASAAIRHENLGKKTVERKRRWNPGLNNEPAKKEFAKRYTDSKLHIRITRSGSGSCRTNSFSCLNSASLKWVPLSMRIKFSPSSLSE